MSIRRKKELEDIKLAAKAKCQELYPMLMALREELAKWEKLYTTSWLKFSDTDRLLAESKVIKIKLADSQEKPKKKEETTMTKAVDNMSKGEILDMISALETRMKRG